MIPSLVIRFLVSLLINTALVFFPHNPLPPKTGAHKRCLEMLAALRSLGIKTTLTSSIDTSETAWTQGSIDLLLDDYVTAVHVYENQAIDRWHEKLLERYYRRFNLEPPVNSALHSPLGMRRWFRKLCNQIQPDLIIMNYAYWDGLIDHRKQRRSFRLIDSLDLLSIHSARKRQLTKSLAKNDIENKGADRNDMLQENYFDSFPTAVDPHELAIYDKYDCTLAISLHEARIISQGTNNTHVELLKMSHGVVSVENSYSDGALFTTGPNIFNLQGYYYFVRRVLPIILKSDPSFRLIVTGYIGSEIKVQNSRGIELLGFVPNLTQYYERARFAICPVFGGTGQQIKIVEAMAHGLPVIALHSAAEASPIKDGINGLVAKDADEFASQAIVLWQDQALCRRLGAAARKTIAHECSPEINVALLRSILEVC